jgi:hypothetical protein
MAAFPLIGGGGRQPQQAGQNKRLGYTNSLLHFWSFVCLFIR